MKRSIPTGSASSSSRRRGALFHYYMMYLFLTSILLTTSGMCIHSILKADQVDSRISRQIQTLLRVERVLRRDVAQSAEADADDQDVVLLRGTGHADIRWSTSQNVVLRETQGDAETATTDRFVFIRGTRPTLQVQGRRVTLIVPEPSATLAQAKNVESKSLATSAEIVAFVKSADQSVSPEEDESGSDESTAGDQS